MELSVTEAALALGVTPRTVRSRAAAGGIAARKTNGQWRIDGSQLDLSPRQEQALQRRAERIRSDVEAALPSKYANPNFERSRSVADLDAFRLLADVARQHTGGCERVSELLDAALCDLAEAAHAFHRSDKRHPVARARRNVAHAVALLFRSGALPARTPNHKALETLESHVLPAIGGYMKWVESERDTARRSPR